MKPIKCVVWDLDHTLWDGILLEGDKPRLKPGIREILVTLDSRGILLSIASKNDYEHAMDQLKRFGKLLIFYIRKSAGAPNRMRWRRFGRR